MDGYCKRYSKVFWFYDREEKRVMMGRLRCKQWNCPFCAIVNRQMWRAFFGRRLPSVASQWWLMTLTAPNDKRGRIESYKALSKGIDTLMKRFNRAFGTYKIDEKTRKKKRVGVQYARIFEKHPASDALHAHFIISGLSDYLRVDRSKNGKDRYTATNFRKGKRGYWSIRTFTKKTAQACRMGYIADCKRLDNTSAANRYVTDYMTKDMQDFDIKGLRHVQTTRGIGSPKGEKKAVLVTGLYISSLSIPDGFKLVDIDTGEIVKNDYWIENGFYPPTSDRNS